MGVQGLWELLAPVGRRVSVETLAGRKLAIDASIWLVQFMKAMRDERGEMIRNAHLIGFFRRICKLLFLRVKPVFVFDGGTPILKRRTVIARRRQRDRAHSKIRKTAEKLLLNHLKTRKLEELIQQIQKAKDEKSNTDAVFEVGEPSGSKRQRQTDVASSSNAASTSNSQSNATQESADALLAASLAADEHSEKGIYDLRDDYHSDDSLDGEEMILPAMQGEIDPAILASLPPSMQLDLLVQMREQQMALNRQKFRKMKKAPASFSQLQIESYLKTVAFRREIEEIQKSASGRGVGGVQSTHIASDPGRGYIFSTSFTGNKETLQISEKATDEISERGQCSTSNSASIRSSIFSETFAPQHESIALDKDVDSSVQTYVDERGQTRVSRVRGLGVRLTRDLQWNLYLMKESEDQATGNQSESAPKETITKETTTQEVSAHTNAKEVGMGQGFEISFTVDEITAEDEQDEFFQALVAQDDGSSANLNFTAHVNSNDDTLECEWEDGEINANVSNEVLQVHSENDHTMAGQVVESDEDSEVEWEDVETNANGNSEILIERTERNNSKATADQLLETTKDTELENENGHSSVNCNMDISVKDSSSLVKNYLCEDEELQEAIRLSLESFHAEKNASNGSKEAISIADFIQGTNKPRESLLGKSSGRTRNDKVDQISCRNDNSFDHDQSTGNQSVHVNGGKHETVIGKFTSNLSGNFDKFVDRAVDKLKEDMVVDGNDVLLCGGQGHNFQSASKDYVATMQMQSSYSRETGEHDLLEKNKFSYRISRDLGFCDSQSEDTVKGAKMARDVVKGVASESKGNVLDNQLEVLEQKEAVMEGGLTNDSESERNVLENKLEVSDQKEAVVGEGLSKGLADDEQLLKRETELLAIKEEIAKKKEYYEKELKEVKEAVQSDLNDEITYLRQEELELRAAQKQQERNADSVSSEMFTECQELLQMFGLPYIIAPMEAEAQCAFMELAKLVDGVVTDDCDAFLFGAECVYKNIFDNRKYVETYLMKDIENELGLNREKLVRMALLLGSDYTEGISGIGIVNAIEVVNAFSEEDGLKTFKDWLDSPDLSILDKLNNSKGKSNKKKQSKLNKNDANVSTTEEERVLESSEGVTEKEQLDERSSVVKEIFMDKHRAVSKNWHVPDCFPNEAVISAYMNPQVDKSTEPCSWGRPDLVCLRKLCWEKFGWAKEKADELLIPVLREFDRHETQLRLESFYSFNERFAKIRSRRIQKAVTGITGRRSSELTDLPPHLTSSNSTRRSRKKQEAAVPTTVSEEATDNALEAQQGNENDKDNGDLQKKQNTRKGAKAQSGGGRPRGRGSSGGQGRGRGRGRKCNETRESDNSLTDTETETGDGKDAEKTVPSSSKEPQIRKSGRKRRKVNYAEDEQGSDKQEEDEVCKDDPPFEAAKVTDPPRSQDYVTVGGGFCDEDAEQPESKDYFTVGGGFCNTNADQPQAKDYLTADGGFCNADEENDTLAVQDESLFIASDDIPNVTVVSETHDRHPSVSKQKQDFQTVDESPGSSQANCKDKQTPGNPAAGSLKAVPFFRRKTRKHTGE